MGLFQLLLGPLRLGMLVNFVSHTVVVGFTAGAAVLIVANQARPFFRVDVPRGGSPFSVARELLTRLAQINPFVTAVAAGTVMASVAARRWLPRVLHLTVAMLAGSLLPCNQQKRRRLVAPFIIKT